MSQRIFRRFDQSHDQFEDVVRDVLEDVPEGLLAHEFHNRVYVHPEFNVYLEPDEFKHWLEEASQDIVLQDSLNP